MSDNEKKNLISLEEATKFCNYSQEYLSLRARRKKLKSVKVGRVWMTTKEWLDDYLKRVGEYKDSLEEKRIKKDIDFKKEVAVATEDKPVIKIEKDPEPPILESQDEEAETKKILPRMLVPEFAISENKVINSLGKTDSKAKDNFPKPIVRNYFSYAYNKTPLSKNSSFFVLFSACLILILTSIFSANFLANLVSGSLLKIAEPVAFSINGFAIMADESFSYVSNDIGQAIKRNPSADNFVSSAGYSLNYTKYTFGQYFSWLYKETKGKAYYAQQKAAVSVSLFSYPFKVFTGYTENILFGQDDYSASDSLDPKLFKELDGLKDRLDEIKKDIDNISKNIPLEIKKE